MTTICNLSWVIIPYISSTTPLQLERGKDNRKKYKYKYLQHSNSIEKVEKK